jgi:hypothetical protein
MTDQNVNLVFKTIFATAWFNHNFTLCLNPVWHLG